MKKEASAKNKKWLWLVLALVAILAVAGVLVAVLFGGGDQDGDAAPTSKLYWNVDKALHTENEEAKELGITTRAPESDGLYHVRLATGGELIEVLVSDAQLINYIDTLDAMGLVFDADGMVVDALDPSLFNPEIVRDFFVKRISDTSITVNSSVAMNGMDMTFDLTTIGLYDVTDTAAQPGMPGTAGLMDRVFVYGDMEGNATDIFVVNRADDAEVYWPLPGYWNSSKKDTTRVPDENGVYTITFAYKGELVDLKCKNKDIVKTIDNTGNVDRCQALKFDEEGYIIATISTQMALKAMRICDRYDVLELNGNQFYAKGYFGSTSGKEVYSTMTDDCEVYLVCDNGTVQKHIGEKTELQLGDRILCYSDLEGNAKLIYVLNRRVDSPLYFNVYPKKISQVYFETLRKPDENGYYNFTLASNGKTKVYRTKDVKLATFLDKQDSRGVGLKLRGDIIEAVYEQESVTGHMIGGIGRYVTGQLGSILSVALANNINNPANLVMNPDVKIYNVSTDKDGTKIGSETTLRPYDEVTIFRNLTGVTEVYVTRRYVEDAKMFWNVEAKLTPDFLETSRTPNGEGYYVFTMAHEGKQVKVKTKDKEMATYIDTRSPKYVALKTKQDPNNPEELIVKYAYDARSLIKAGYYASADYFYDYLNKEEGRHYVYYLKGDEKVTGGTKVYKNSKMKAFNISDSFELIKGEKTTLRKDDKVQFIVSAIDWVAHYAYITDRQIDAPLAYNQKQMYNATTKETTRTPDANGYYVFDLAVNGEVKQYKTKDKAIASKLDSYTSAFTLKAKGDIIQGVYYAKIAEEVQAMSIGRFDVTSIDGNKVTFTRNRPTSSNYGEVSERVIAKNCKIYDVSPYAEKWGGAVKLGLGDRVEAYSNKDGELCYIYIVYACTREDGPVSYCDHCDKEVWWEPYVGDNFAVDDIHYYFPTESTVKVSFGIGANEKPVIANGTSFNINSLIKAYKGVKFEGKKMGSEVTVQDTNPIADKANKQTFPSDGTNYEAMCYACGEKVVWKALTKDAVWHKMYNPNYNNEAEEEWHSHFYVPNDLSMNRTDKALINNALGSKTLATSTMCIHLNGKTIKTKGEITVEKSILNIMGEGVIDADCSGTASVANGTIYVKNSSGKLNLYGGTYKNSSTRMEASFVFDLNGQNVHTTGKLAQVYGNMDIFDYAGGGVLSTNSAKGAIGGVVVVGENGVVNLHSGTLSSASANPAANGAAVYVYKGGTFNMLGGALVDGAAEKGGNIAVAGTFNMKGGTISGGSATTGGNVYVYMGGKVNMTGGKIVNNVSGRNVYVGDSTFNMSGGTISTNGTANIYLIDAATFNMSGGTVTGGTAANGGNFYLQATNGKKDAGGNQVYATLNLSGGTVSNGTATETGGNLCLMPFGKLVHTGGTITGGTATNGANINVGSANAKLTLGGTITNGQVHVGKNNTTTLTGKVKIDDLRITDNAKIYLDNLDTTAKIKVTANGAFTNANEKAKDYVKSFEAAETTKVVQELEGVLYYGDPISECPACGKTTAWTDITKYGRISSSIGVSHWILSDDFTYADDLVNSIVYSNKADYTMCINLNGKTLTAGNAIDARQGTLNIFGGGEFICTSESTNARSGMSAISVDGTAVVNLYDDITIRNTVAGESVVYGYAGNPTVNVHDTVKLDGDVTVRSGSLTLNMQGGEVTGKVTGSNLILAGAAKVADASIADSKKLTVESGWSGSAVVEFVSYDYDPATPGFLYVPAANVEIKGAYTGTLKNAEGETYVVDGGRLKVASDYAPLTPAEIVAKSNAMTFPTDGSDSEQLCPHCNKVVVWKAATLDGGFLKNKYNHYYLATDLTITGNLPALQVNTTHGGGELCFHFNDNTITAEGGIQVVGQKLNLMGKGGLVNSNTSSAYGLFGIRIHGSGTVNVYGGTYKTTGTAAGIHSLQFREVKTGIATFNLYGDTALIRAGGAEVGYSRSEADNVKANCIVNDNRGVGGEHSHSYSTVVTAPTCTEPGYTTHTCSCGHSYKDTEVAATGHTAANAEGKCGTCGFVLDIATYAEKMTFPTDGSNSEQLCPVCNKVVTWHPITDGNRGSGSMYAHWYVAEDINYTCPDDKQNGFLYLNSASGSICVNFNGKTVNSNASIDLADGTMNLMGKGNFNSDCSAKQENVNLGVISLRNAADELNIYGGTYTSTTSGKRVLYGWGSSQATINLYGNTQLVAPEGTDLIRNNGGMTINDERHTHSYTAVVTAPTCTEPGYTTHTCSCGDSYKDTEVAATGHTAANAEGKCGTCGFVLDIATYAEKMTFPTDGSNSEQLCPVCNKVVTWHPITDGNRGSGSMYAHWYVAEDINYTCPDDKQDGFVYLNSATGSVCVNFNGKTVNSNASIDLADGTMNLMGKGNFNSDCSAKQENVNLGVISLRNAADELNIYGGTYTSTTSGKRVLYGWGSSQATINLYGNTQLVAPEGTDLIRNNGGMTINDERHTHSYTAVVTAPTCTEPGYTTHTCSCGDSYKDTEVAATGHTAPTPTGVCFNCDKVLNIALYAEQMTFPTDGSNSEQLCPVCNAVATWHPITNGNRGSGSMYSHWYVAEDVTYTCPDDKQDGFVYLNSATGSVCVNFNGKTVNSNASIDLADGTMNLMGKGNFNSSCEAAQENVNLGVISLRNAADELNIYGGTYTSTTSGKRVLYGWGSSQATINLYGNTQLVAPEGTDLIRNNGGMTINKDSHVHADNGKGSCDCGIVMDIAIYAENMTFPTDASNSVQYCPVCQKNMTWHPITDGNRGSGSMYSHWYVANDVVNYACPDNKQDGFVYLNSATGSVCVNFNGKTVNSNASIDLADGTMNLMGKGNFNCSCEAAQENVQLGAITLRTAADVLNIYGGTYTSTKAGKPAIYGWGSAAATINLYGNTRFVVTEGAQEIRNNGGMTVVDHRHIHSYNAVVTPPTCTEAGYTTYTCDCGDSYVGNNVPATHPDANGDKECDVCLKNLNNPGQTGIDLGKTVREKSAEVKSLFEDATDDVVAVCPVCGEEKTWTAWTVAKNTNIPSVDGGHYYMAEDLAKIFYGPASGTACLNLNGKTLSGANPIYAGLGTTNIIDTAGTGKVIGQRENQAKGAAIFFDGTHGISPSGTTSVINLFGGTYTRNNVQKNASIVAIDTNGGTINMYAGAKITAEGISTSGSAYGLAVLIQGSSTNQATFNMYGGEIVGGTNLTGNGGAVCVGFSAKNKAAFNLYDGKISGGQAQYGGNIYVYNGGELNVYDGAILGGKAKSTGANGFGGNICVRGHATDGGGILRVHGGYILGGAAYSRNSNNVLAAAGQTVYLGDSATSTFVMTGGRIVGQVRCGQSLTAQISGCAKDLPSFTYDGVTYTSTSGLANINFTVANLGKGAEIWANAGLDTCYKYCDTCAAAYKHTLVAGPEAITANGHYVYKTGDVYTFVCKK